MEPAPREIDEREVRTAQAATGVLLLAAFVFRIPLLVVGVTIIVAFGAAFGPRLNGFHTAYRAALGPRLTAPRAVVGADEVRALDVLATGLLLLASVAFLLGIDLLGWLFTLIEAAVAIVEATTGYNAAQELIARVRRER